MRNSIRSFTLFVTVGGILLTLGCESTDLRSLNEVEKAQRITRLRTQSMEELALFRQSDGADLEALKKHVKLEGQTTQVAPVTCPICYSRYGQALSRLGLYYRDLVGAFRRELEQVDPSERPSIEEKIERYHEKVLVNFQASNRQFSVYFQSGEVIEPRAYEWVFRQYEALGDYRQALFYLEQFLANTTLTPEGRANAKQLKAAYGNQVLRQEEAELRRELEADFGDDGVRGARLNKGAGARTEVGN